MGAEMRDNKPPIRLAELVVALSSVADLGIGLPVGSAARTALIAVQLARSRGWPEAAVGHVFYAALLQHIGCTAYSHEVTALFTDEFSVKRASMATDFTRPQEVLRDYLPELTRHAPPGERLRTLRSGLLHSRRMTDGYRLSNCETAAAVARRLGLPDEVRTGLLDNFEWWNGKGGPRGLQGEDISPIARVVNVAGYASFFDQRGGPETAAAAIEQRSSRYFDPALATAFCRHAKELLAETAAGDVSDRLVAAEPAPAVQVPPTEVEEVLRVFGEAVDLKSPCLHGHATTVSRLADGACRRLGLAQADVELARQAGLVQDLGRVAVATGIWEYPGRLGSDAWSQVRLHTYHSEQILARSKALGRLATLAGLHHERLDGSGYYRRIAAAQLPMTARVLATADVFQALTVDRPHRRAYSSDAAAAVVLAEARGGRLDPDAADAVLAVADGTPMSRRRQVAGLTDRQLEVIRLIARGLSNRAIAGELVISTRTAEHHVQDIYARIGVSSRAATALYAMEHGLL
ncbi:HD domain-containing phosphohydrolase [Kribbella sp. NPDC059898]|uniref:HD domain-containing phosphohydrolase n=1 Tax=Kribbella sp. NPDC059898 TaxID=3346995 RepID=UPI003665939D